MNLTKSHHRTNHFSTVTMVHTTCQCCPLFSLLSAILRPPLSAHFSRTAHFHTLFPPFRTLFTFSSLSSMCFSVCLSVSFICLSLFIFFAFQLRSDQSIFCAPISEPIRKRIRKSSFRHRQPHSLRRQSPDWAQPPPVPPFTRVS